MRLFIFIILRVLFDFSVYYLMRRYEGRGKSVRDSEIITLLLARDQRGIDLLYEHYGSLMRYVIAPIVLNADDREECLCESAMRIWYKIDTYDEIIGTFGAWITAITRNVALNYVRQSTKLIAQSIPDNTPSFYPTPEQALIDKENKFELQNALNSLSPRNKMIIYRKYYYKQSVSQIAKELGITQRAVEGRLYRLKRQLRNMLGGEQSE